MQLCASSCISATRKKLREVEHDRVKEFSKFAFPFARRVFPSSFATNLDRAEIVSDDRSYKVMYNKLCQAHFTIMSMSGDKTHHKYEVEFDKIHLRGNLVVVQKLHSAPQKFDANEVIYGESVLES